MKGAARTRRRALAALLAAAPICACGSSPSGDAGEPELAAPIRPCRELRASEPAVRRSVVLVVGDTLRRDRFGAYGGPARTPAFDAFARANRLFTRAYSQAPWTKPSVATLFTGLHPSQHGVLSHPERRAQPQPEAADSDVLSGDLHTLAEDLRAAGYETAAFVGNPWLVRELGFAQGFDVYDDSLARWGASDGAVVRAALDWLEGRRSAAPFLLYVHTLAGHTPYRPIPTAAVEGRRAALVADARPLDAAASRRVAELARGPDGSSAARGAIAPSRALLELAYDQGVEAFDRALGELLAALAARAIEPEPAVWITSDHGEALFERGWVDHGGGLHDDELALPMAAHLPGVTGPDRVACPLGLVDIRSTLCDYLALECPEPRSGTSLLAAPAGAAGRYLVSEGVARRPGHRAIRNETYKLLYQPRGNPVGGSGPGGYSLFAVGEDPDETRELLAGGEEDARVQRVFRTLSRALHERASARAAPPAPPARLDAATRRRLEALGYAPRAAAPAPARR